MKILVMDFGGSSVKYALVDAQGQILSSGKKTPAPLQSKEAFVATAKEIYLAHKEEADGVSLSMPGYIDAARGVLVSSGAYTALYGCCVSELLRTEIPAPIAVENDGRCGALAETWKGALSDCDDGVVLILGSGIAGGIVKDRKIHAGKSFAAGEFSNYIVDPRNPSFLGEAVMNCAAFGLTYRLCKEKNIDLSCQDLGETMLGIDKIYGAQFTVFDAPPKKIKADGEQLALWLKEGDAAARKIYDGFLASLAFMIVNIQITYAPEKVVVGGGLSRIAHLQSDLQEELNHYYSGAGFGKELQTQLAFSSYLDECNLLGAAYHYLQKFGTHEKDC